MILIFLLSIFCEDKELNEFINKDIKIFFAGYPTTFLGRDNDGSELVAHNKYVTFEKLKFNPKARIIKDGKNFEIYFSGARICKSGNRILKCSSLNSWSIDRKYFGYSISKDGLCITKDIDDTVKMKNCVDTDDQIFSFKLVTPDCDSEEKLGDHHSVHVNLIQDNVKKFSIKNSHSSEDNGNKLKEDDCNLEELRGLEGLSEEFTMEE